MVSTLYTILNTVPLSVTSNSGKPCVANMDRKQSMVTEEVADVTGFTWSRHLQQ